jgi:Transposase
VTTLYFESDYEDDLRKTGFSKEGRHQNPQIILGLLMSRDGYPLAYCIHEGNKYEGYTMLPTVKEFVNKYNLNDFMIIADSGLMNNANVAELEKMGYKDIIGAKIKNESAIVKKWILEQPKVDCQMVEYDKDCLLDTQMRELRKTNTIAIKALEGLKSPIVQVL